jgi:hypothetical protein
MPSSAVFQPPITSLPSTAVHMCIAIYACTTILHPTAICRLFQMRQVGSRVGMISIPSKCWKILLVWSYTSQRKVPRRGGKISCCTPDLVHSKVLWHCDTAVRDWARSSHGQRFKVFCLAGKEVTLSGCTEAMLPKCISTSAYTALVN